jgi:Dolichyl-phosphate-mannose-protein mannosyltransferase
MTTLTPNRLRSRPAAPTGSPRHATTTGRRRLVPRFIELGLLAAITVLGGWLRAPGLGVSSLWFDDAWVAYAARADYSELNLIGLTSVGFVTIEKIWLDLVGFSNLNAQLLPYLAGTFAPGAVYLVLRRRAASHTALLGAAVMALTTIHVQYSPRVKQYTIEALLVLLLLALTFRWRTEPSRKNTGILVAAMVVACMFSFILAAACLTPLVVMVLTARDDDRTRRLVTGGVSAMVPVLGLWYFVMVRPRVEDWLIAFWADHYIDASNGPVQLLTSTWDAFARLFEVVAPFPATVTLVVLAAAFVGLVRRDAVLAVALIAPLAAAAALAVMQKAPLGGGRTDIYLVPGLVVLFVLGLEALTDRQRPKAGALAPGAVAALVVVAVLGLSYDGPDPVYPREDVRPLIAELEVRRQSGDPVVVYYAATYSYGLYAATNSTPVDVDGPYLLNFSDPLVIPMVRQTDTAQYRSYAKDALATSDRFWLVATRMDLTAHWPVVQEILAEDLGLDLVDSSESEGAVLQLWQRPDEAPK